MNRARNWRYAEWGETGAAKLPDKPGVYVVYCNDMIGYIGQTECLRSRFSTGHNIYQADDGTYQTPWGVFASCRIKYAVCRRVGEWLMLECRLIRRLEPRFNQQISRHGRNKTRFRPYRRIGMPVYPDGAGATIPGSQLLRDFCASCRTPMRVATIEECNGERIEAFCEKCDPGQPRHFTPKNRHESARFRQSTQPA